MKSLIDIVLVFVPHFKTDWFVLNFDKTGIAIPKFPANLLVYGDENSIYMIAKMQLFVFFGFVICEKFVSEIMTYQEYKREITKNDA